MVLAPLVEPLFILLTFLGALLLAWLAAKIVEALFQVAESHVGWIPWLGSRITGDLHRIEQRITNKLGGVALGLQHRVGASWHSLARLVDETGQKIEDAYRLIGGLAGVLDLFVPWKALMGIIHALQRAVAALHGTTKAQSVAVAHVGRVAGDARRRADTAKVRAQAIPANVVLPGDLAGLRGQVKAAEDRIGRLWARVRGLSLPAAGGLALGALAFALGRLGIGWARCGNVGKVGRNVCGMDAGLLESLLADSLLILGTLSLVTFAEEMQDVTEVVARPIQTFWRAS